MVPSARKLFNTYVTLLIAIAAVAAIFAVVAAAGKRGHERSARESPTDSEFATVVVFRGPAPETVLDVGGAAGEAFYYGPLSAGECLPAIDVAAFEAHFGFRGVGVVFNFGGRVGDELRIGSSFAELPHRFPMDMPYLQVCFPSGVDHEQVLWLSPRPGGRGRSAFLDSSAIAPPPLLRQPSRLSVYTGRIPGRYVTVGDRTAFSAVGRRCELRFEEPAPVVLELGEIEAGAAFVVRETVRVSPGEGSPELARVRWPHFRILLPEGGARAHFDLSADPAA